MLILFRVYLIIAIVIAVAAFYSTLKHSEEEDLKYIQYVIGVGIGATIGGVTWPLIVLGSILYNFCYRET